MTGMSRRIYAGHIASQHAAGLLFMKICAYVDGFNVYHFLVSYIEKNKKSPTLKWSNPAQVVRFFAPEKNAQIITHLFIGFPEHRDEGQQNRHRLYIQALRHFGIHVVEGRFNKKKKHITCPKCQEKFTKLSHEEKEVDVALGVQMISDLHIHKPEKIIIISNDTDFKPPVRNALKHSQVKIVLLSPLGVDKRDSAHFHYKDIYKDIKEEYKGRFTIKSIKLIQKSIMPVLCRIKLLPMMAKLLHSLIIKRRTHE